MVIKAIPFLTLLTATALTALPVLASEHHNLPALERTNNGKGLLAQVNRKLQFSPRNLKQGTNQFQINSRQWVEMTVKGDYVTEVILKNRDGGYSRLKIKQGSGEPSHVTGEGYWYFKSNGCVCWEDEEGQQSVCSDPCFD
jgi:hypothetical protein